MTDWVEHGHDFRTHTWTNRNTIPLRSTLSERVVDSNGSLLNYVEPQNEQASQKVLNATFSDAKYSFAAVESFAAVVHRNSPFICGVGRFGDHDNDCEKILSSRKMETILSSTSFASFAEFVIKEAFRIAIAWKAWIQKLQISFVLHKHN